MKKIVIALGGNALLKRGEDFTAENQIKNAKIAAESIAKIALDNQVVIVHGNGPQVGLLALQNEAYTKVPPYDFDILVAETQGMIGYFMQQAIKNQCLNKEVVTVVTQVVVDINDQAFIKPTKPIGPVYHSMEEANLAAIGKNWTIMPDGNYFRRAVPSPMPQAIVEISTIKNIISTGGIVIAVGGGGIPVIKQESGQYVGVEAVIDKDLSAALLAASIEADMFIILSDVEGVYLDWGTPNQHLVSQMTLAEAAQYNFAAGSMGPKIKAITQFVKNTGKLGAIGSLCDCSEIIQKTKGTIFTK